MRAINTYGLNEGCAQWLLQAFHVPLALNEIVRIEFLNLGGLVSFTRVLELHTSSRDVAAAVLKVTNSLLDDPRVKIEIKKKGEIVMRIRNIPKNIAKLTEGQLAMYHSCIEKLASS